MKRILFLTHDTSRTGAPLVLLYFMQWLQKKEGYKIDCLSLGDGPIKPNFIEATKQFYQLKNNKPLNLIDKIINKIGSKKPVFKYNEQLLTELNKNNYDLIYANSVVSLKWAFEIKKRNVNAKLVLHLHELQGVIKSTFPNISDDIEKLDFCICVSNMVRESLMKNYSFPIKKTGIVYEFSKNLFPDSKELKTSNNENVFIVGGSGSVNKRKGYDLFIAVAIEVSRQAPDLNIQFNWIGKISNKKTELEIQMDLEKSNSKSLINFSGEETNPFKRYNRFDIFLMTSREDPFPLVCIEVANLGKPIICFENATGTQEIIKLGGGKIVPYLSIYRMASEVINYANNREELLRDGRIAKENFQNFTVEDQAPKIYNIINDLLITK